MADQYNFGMDFQKQILRFLLNKENFHEYRVFIQAEYFGNEMHRAIYGLIQAHYEKYKEIPSLEILQEEVRTSGQSLNKDYLNSEISSIFAMREENNFAYIRDKVVVFAQHQAMKNAILQSADALKVGDYAKIKELIAEANKVGDVQDIGLEYFTSMADGSFFRGQDQKDTRIHTLLGELDKYMGGGIDYGELGIILGSSKRGKSMFLVNMGKAAIIGGKKVVHYTFELSLKKTAKRYDSTFSGIEYKKMENDPVDIRDRVMNIMNELVVNEALVIKSYPTRSCTVDMIASHLDRLQAKGFYPDMLVVDYADIMRANRHINDSLKEEASIYEDLRGLAMSRNVAIWTAAQAGRQAFGKTMVEMEDTGGTISKIQIADFIITLCQSKDEKALTPPVMRLFVAGARDVEDGSYIKVQTDFGRISIGGMSKDE